MKFGNSPAGQAGGTLAHGEQSAEKTQGCMPGARGVQTSNTRKISKTNFLNHASVLDASQHFGNFAWFELGVERNLGAIRLAFETWVSAAAQFLHRELEESILRMFCRAGGAALSGARLSRAIHPGSMTYDRLMLLAIPGDSAA